LWRTATARKITSPEARDKRIFDLWLACWTQEEIAEMVGMTDFARVRKELISTRSPSP
jgi:hypothetical protein